MVLNENKYLFNSKELQDEQLGGINLDLYDYHSRMFDPALGRWNAIDPLAEDYYDQSPYHFAGNNPIVFVDPNGLAYYYSAYGTFLGDDGKDDELIYTTTQNLIGQQTDKDGNINWDNVVGGEGTEKIGEFGDFVNMNGYSISSDNLKQNLVGLSINMQSTGTTDGYATIQVVSGDRSAAKNKEVGGSKGSMHTQGKAADIKVSGMSNETLAKAAGSYGKFGGVIFYPDYGDTQGLGTHQQKNISYTPFFDGVHEKMAATVYYTTVLNAQRLAPHVHVDMRSKPYLGRYTGHNGTKNTYKSWVSKNKIR